MNRDEMDRKTVSIEDIAPITEALIALQLEFDIQKRYVKKPRPAGEVYIAEYTIVIYARSDADAKRLE